MTSTIERHLRFLPLQWAAFFCHALVHRTGTMTRDRLYVLQNNTYTSYWASSCIGLGRAYTGCRWSSDHSSRTPLRRHRNRPVRNVFGMPR
ncbi:hypothetical protein MHPYR_210074 [uncultured Mycobacterium sp.]|uniref:Uncharacterized protein n=1 Tax=uncultured Mycobacterium sp. TaxID=171292 RepID=A0A1Y5PD92_9MYCO|nr:hypothetical protein MHPYR_210074 [uncultured Mycobacterium sp.]